MWILIQFVGEQFSLSKNFQFGNTIHNTIHDILRILSLGYTQGWWYVNFRRISWKQNKFWSTKIATSSLNSMFCVLSECINTYKCYISDEKSLRHNQRCKISKCFDYSISFIHGILIPRLLYVSILCMVFQRFIVFVDDGIHVKLS